MERRSGVYAIVDPSGEMYIGSSTNIVHRWYVHRYQLRKGKHHSHTLQAAWNECGDAGLEFRELEMCDEADLLEVEQRFFDHLKPKHNIYLTAGSPAGTRVLDETKKKLSARSKGRVISEETRAKRSAAFKGRKKSEEHKRKLSLSYPHCRAVRCKETGQIFRSTTDATKWLRETLRPTASNSMIIKVCKGFMKAAYGYTWEYVAEQKEAA
jgi:group I intron endonuclease